MYARQQHTTAGGAGEKGFYFGLVQWWACSLLKTEGRKSTTAPAFWHASWMAGQVMQLLCPQLSSAWELCVTSTLHLYNYPSNNPRRNDKLTLMASTSAWDAPVLLFSGCAATPGVNLKTTHYLDNTQTWICVLSSPKWNELIHWPNTAALNNTVVTAFGFGLQ